MHRIVRNAVWILLVLTGGGLLLEGWQFAVSVVVGGGLALGNFYWLGGLVDSFLAGADTAAGPPSAARVALSWTARVLLILATLFAMIQLSFFRPLGAVFGLSIFVLAGMLEAALLAVQKKV